MSKTVFPLRAREAFKQRTRSLFGLQPQPIELLCDYCGKFVPSDMKWRCGYCNHENHRTEVYSFLSKCQACGREPKAFVCPHPQCGHVNFLDEDKDGSHPAQQIVERPKPVPQEDPKAQKRREHESRKEDLEREIELAKLNSVLAQAKAAGEINKDPTAQEKMKEEIRRYLERVMGDHMAAEELRAEFAERYKDDPETMKMVNEAIERFLEDHA